MPIRTTIDNTYHLFDSTAGRLTNWPSGARISQIRLHAVNTAAAATFQIAAGTPFFEWAYVGAGAGIAPGHYIFPMGGVPCPTAFIPTTLTACTAWIDFA